MGKPEGGLVAGYRWHSAELAKIFAPPEDGRPLIVLGRVGRAPARNPREVSALVKALLPVIDAFVELAIEHCAEPQGRLLRIALPLLGTGEGGLRGAKGDVIRPLLAHLNKLVRDRGIDLILCTVNALAWSAVQSARTDDEWRLTSSEERLAASLAAEARAGRLVFFIGAGVSRDAGLPDWNGLLNALHRGDISEEEKPTLNNLDPRDHAMLIELAIGGRAQLLARLAQEVGSYERFGLTHSLLASIGAEQAVTTNYDNLYERACTRPGDDLDDDLAVLPYGRVAENRPWLLKLHGSLDQLDREDHIVLTRPDYMSLARDRSALFGIVQALLVTKHLLFVGYSQMFLDRVAHLATPHDAHLLDESFAGLLDSEEGRIASSLKAVQRVVDDVLKKRPDHITAQAVSRALKQFGSPQPTSGLTRESESHDGR